MIPQSRSRYTYQSGGGDGRMPFGSNSMQHGTAVFEGIRCYQGSSGPSIFRLEDHLTRLLRSASLIGIPDPPTRDHLHRQVVAATAESAMADCYVRPVLYAPDPVLELDLHRLTYAFGIEIWPVGQTGGPAAAAALAVSPWRRPPAACFPAGAKATGAYVMSAVARTHANRLGFDDALQLDVNTGRVVEATVSNVFFVQNGRLLTPWLQDGPLAGITRDTVLTLAGDLGIETREGPVEVADLLEADEIFLTGTAVELVPVRALGERPIEPGGPVFRAIQNRFRSAVTGGIREKEHWLTPLRTQVSAPN